MQRHWGKLSISQEVLCTYRKPGVKYGTDCPSQPSEGTLPVTPSFRTSSLKNCEMINFCFKPSSFCYFAVVVTINKYSSDPPKATKL